MAALTLLRCAVLPVLLLSLLHHVSRAQSISVLSSCLPASFPLAVPGSDAFPYLSTLNFRFNHRTPAAIVRARSDLDVQLAVQCARAANLTICARAGGHSFAGNSVCTGLMIDVGDFTDVKFITRKIVSIGAGVTSGELVWKLWNRQRKWAPIGVCPGIGFTGFILGGGHGPYEGRLSLACDSLDSVRMVTHTGRLVVATRRRHKDLFWGSCGAGGGQFGVVVAYRMRVRSARPYDRSVYFRFSWARKQAGDVLHKYMSYNQMGGKVWVRMEMSLETEEPGLHACGACYGVSSVEQCMQRLNRASFFGVPSRKKLLMVKAESAPELQAFFGPAGNWCRQQVPKHELKDALTAQKYSEAGFGNDRMYTSALIKKSLAPEPPSKSFWQAYADFCLDPGLPSLPWVVCHLNVFNNAVDKPRFNAFAHRGADLITLYFVGGGTPEDKAAAEAWIRGHFKPYTSGIYVNFPVETETNYAQLYWGNKLPRLSALKNKYDPDGVFSHPQPIPMTL